MREIREISLRCNSRTGGRATEGEMGFQNGPAVNSPSKFQKLNAAPESKVVFAKVAWNCHFRWNKCLKYWYRLTISSTKRKYTKTKIWRRKLAGGRADGPAVNSPSKFQKLNDGSESEMVFAKVAWNCSLGWIKCINYWNRTILSKSRFATQPLEVDTCFMTQNLLRIKFRFLQSLKFE